jgi:hypothetical protein
MARNQKNFQNFLYVDDSAVDWTKRGEDGGAGAAVDGHASGNGAPTWIDGPRMRARRVIAQDPTTFRTISFVVYTPTAFAAINKGDTIAVQVAGLATTVNYTVVDKKAEKQPATRAARQLADA